MPKEVRYIVFDSAEAEQAVLQHLIPPNAIVSPRITEYLKIAFSDTPRYGIGAEISGLQTEIGLNQVRRLDETEVLSALLTWCRRSHIPLPRRGTKGVELVGGSIALALTLNAMRTKTMVTENRVRYADPQLEEVPAPG
jgi:hypothetical protein